jgi:hypothetical protein
MLFFSLLSALGMEAVSPDLEKQGFLAVVFVNLEFSGQPDPWGTPKLCFCYNLKYSI